jgi:nitroimidazol reductase NimA-like FMN-containing flavoprotein (pyridoxamine 5'-phosphate oxidase superfamily)
MAERKPVAEQNLDGYGAPLIPWARARERLEQKADKYWLATVRPDGRPHVMPVFVVWLSGALYFVAGETTRKAKNLAHNAHCVITFAADGLDLVVEGQAAKVSDEAKLQLVAQVYASKYDWHPTVRDGAFYAEYGAPSAGPPPWDLYEVTPTKVFGLGTAEPYGATRWSF